jgi:Cu/Ag efflux pump CusA
LGLSYLRSQVAIAAPMLGGMVTAPMLSLFVVPAVYALMRRRAPLPRQGAESQP